MAMLSTWGLLSNQYLSEKKSPQEKSWEYAQGWGTLKTRVRSYNYYLGYVYMDLPDKQFTLTNTSSTNSVFLINEQKRSNLNLTQLNLPLLIQGLKNYNR